MSTRALARAASHAARGGRLRVLRGAFGRGRARRGPRDARERGVRGMAQRSSLRLSRGGHQIRLPRVRRPRQDVHQPPRRFGTARGHRGRRARGHGERASRADRRARRRRAESSRGARKTGGPARLADARAMRAIFRDGPFRAVEPHAARRPSLQRGARVAVQARRIAGARRAGRRGARRVARRLDGGVARVVGAGGRRRRTRRARLRRGVVLAGSSALKRRTRVDVDSAHATLLRRVGKHAGLREVLGSPIVGARGNARVALVTGGEWRRDFQTETERSTGLKNAFRKKWRWRDERAHVAFPIAGSRARGMVAAEIVKRAGYPPTFELVAVDVEAENGRDAHRVYLAGGLRERERADAVVAALRAPWASRWTRRTTRSARGRAPRRGDEKRGGGGGGGGARPQAARRGRGMWPAERAMDAAASIAHGARRWWGRATGRRST